jgi:hypothetical protein
MMNVPATARALRKYRLQSRSVSHETAVPVYQMARRVATEGEARQNRGSCN